jgi:hypothetical protein
MAVSIIANTSRPAAPAVANLSRASHQWASRPVDERFWGIDDCLASAEKDMTESAEFSFPVSALNARPGSNGNSGEIILSGKGADLEGNQIEFEDVIPSNWGFDQLCNYADAPAHYLRRLSPETAVKCMDEGLHNYRGEHMQMMIRTRDDVSTLRSVTSKYSRLWDARALRALRPAVDKGWMVPPARPCVDDPRARPAKKTDIIPNAKDFGIQVKVGDMIAPAGVYRSDRDLFVFMIQPSAVIDLDNGNNLMRGFFLWNSEVGKGAWSIETFLCEAVCGNHIVWGATDVRKKRLVHKGKNFLNDDNMVAHMDALINAMDADTSAERGMLTSAKSHILGKNREETVETVYGMKRIGLAQKVIEAGYSYAERFEDTAGANPNTVWGLVHGLTRYSQTIPFTDGRHAIDEGAGKLLALACNA